MRRAAGFTLVELLTTVTVAGVLLAVAAPSFIELSVRNRLSGYTNEFVAAIYLARSEAVKTGRTVSICPSADAEDCGGSWNQGWIVFRDDNADGIVGDEPEKILKTYDAVADGFTVGSDDNLESRITFGPDGAADRVGVLAFCRGSNTEGARAVVVTRLRPRLAADRNGDRIPDLDDGSNIGSCAAPTPTPEEEEA